MDGIRIQMLIVKLISLSRFYIDFIRFVAIQMGEILKAGLINTIILPLKMIIYGLEPIGKR